jgi:hypothetical protein
MKKRREDAVAAPCVDPRGGSPPHYEGGGTVVPEGCNANSYRRGEEACASAGSPDPVNAGALAVADEGELTKRCRELGGAAGWLRAGEATSSGGRSSSQSGPHAGFRAEAAGTKDQEGMAPTGRLVQKGRSLEQAPKAAASSAMGAQRRVLEMGAECSGAMTTFTKV